MGDLQLEPLAGAVGAYATYRIATHVSYNPQS